MGQGDRPLTSGILSEVDPSGRVLAIVGPTASGKSVLAMDVAERLGAEIVSADSRQVYRGLDIGTAKPSAGERARVRHHFVDEFCPGEPFSAGQFARSAENRIDSIRARGLDAVVAGGSTLYVAALARGIADLPQLDAEIERAVRSDALTPEGRAALFQELQVADPDAASTLDATKSQRLARLVSILRSTGHPPSSFWATTPPPRFPLVQVAIDWPREALYARIEARVDQMIADGLVEENERLLAAGFALDTNPLRTIGYQEPIAFLRGEIARDEMVRLLKQNTRRYAKRQLTWFRRDPSVTWLPPSAGPDDALAVLRSAGE